MIDLLPEEKKKLFCKKAFFFSPGTPSSFSKNSYILLLSTKCISKIGNINPVKQEISFFLKCNLTNKKAVLK